MSLLTPAALAQAIDAAKTLVAAQILDALDPEELQTIELRDAARYLGINSKTAERILPVIEVGERTHRVSLKAFQAFKELRTKWPDEDALRKYLDRESGRRG